MKSPATNTITLPTPLRQQVATIAKQVGKTESLILQEAIGQYFIQTESARLAEVGKKQSKALGLKPSDVNRLIKESRREQTKNSR